jgi:hypothetical protein
MVDWLHSSIDSFLGQLNDPGTGSDEFASGDLVEYWSGSYKAWIPARVLDVLDDGTAYRLDVKERADKKNIRKKPSANVHAATEPALAQPLAPAGLDGLSQRTQKTSIPMPELRPPSVGHLSEATETFSNINLNESMRSEHIDDMSVEAGLNTSPEPQLAWPTPSGSERVVESHPMHQIQSSIASLRMSTADGIPATEIPTVNSPNARSPDLDSTTNNSANLSQSGLNQSVKSLKSERSVRGLFGLRKDKKSRKSSDESNLSKASPIKFDPDEGFGVIPVAGEVGMPEMPPVSRSSRKFS